MLIIDIPKSPIIARIAARSANIPMILAWFFSLE
jgi:hypothetical protein